MLQVKSRVRTGISLPSESERLNAAQPEPKELIRAQGQQIREVSDSWKQISSEHFDGNMSFILLQIQFYRLR